MKISNHPDAGLRLLLDSDDVWALINHLRTAAAVYDRDAKGAYEDRIKEQFVKQRDQALAWAEKIEEQA